MYQKKLLIAWNQLKWCIFGSTLQEMLWGTGSLVRLQTLRNKLIFPKEMYKGRHLQILVRICYRYPPSQILKCFENETAQK